MKLSLRAKDIAEEAAEDADATAAGVAGGNEIVRQPTYSPPLPPIHLGSCSRQTTLCLNELLQPSWTCGDLN